VVSLLSHQFSGEPSLQISLGHKSVDLLLVQTFKEINDLNYFSGRF